MGFIAGLFGYTATIAPPPSVPIIPYVQSVPYQTLGEALPDIISPPLLAPKEETVTVQKKEYNKTQYAELKTSLANKVDFRIPLKQDEDNNEAAQFYEIVQIEKEECGGRIGVVNGNVIDSLNNLLKNGCPK